MELGRLRAGVASGCEPIGPGHQAAIDDMGDEEGQVFGWDGADKGLQRQSFR